MRTPYPLPSITPRSSLFFFFFNKRGGERASSLPWRARNDRIGARVSYRLDPLLSLSSSKQILVLRSLAGLGFGLTFCVLRGDFFCQWSQFYRLRSGMATENKPAAAEDAKIDLFEDDDEFEEFEIDQGNAYGSVFVSFAAIDESLRFAVEF